MLKNIKYLSPILISLYTIRTLIFGAHIADALVLTSLSCLYGFWLYLESNKEPEVNVDLKNRLISLEESLSATKDKVASISLASSLRR